MTLKRKRDEYQNQQPGITNDLDVLFGIPEDTDSTPTHNILRRAGTKAVPSSLPLANMVTTVQELIDPDFDPILDVVDESPRFLKPLPSRISPEDIAYLSARGALTVPELPLRNELLRAYVQWVYNFMPLLDLHDFLQGIAENDYNANISLLLFQAVMFAGTAFVDLEHLQAAGFATRRDARQAFFMRTRLLYSFDYEDDRIAILQAILLMTYWHEIDGSPQKDIWHWVGVCNTQAQSIGLHRDPTRSDMSSATRRLRTRLWWSLYSRDRLIALALRRPTQINEGNCDVPVPRLSDFDIRPLHSAVNHLLQCRQTGDPSHQRRLATMFIEKVKLCQCLGRILFAQYSPSNQNFGATHKTTITLVPRQSSEAELDRCSQKLDAWVSSLPKEAHFIPPRSQQLKEGENVLLLHSAMLRMIYHATCGALHRPQALTFSKKSYTTQKTRDRPVSARQKMLDAASKTTEIAHNLNCLGLAKFLPTSGVTVVLPAAVVHLTNLASSNPTVRHESTWKFHRCIEVLNKLKDIYPAADYETAYLEEAARMQLKHVQQNNPIMIMQSNVFHLLGKADSSQINHVTVDNDYMPLSITADDARTSQVQSGNPSSAQNERINDHDQNQRIIVDLDNEDEDERDSDPIHTFLDRDTPQRDLGWNWNVDIFNNWLEATEGEEEREPESENCHNHRQTDFPDLPTVAIGLDDDGDDDDENRDLREAREYLSSIEERPASFSAPVLQSFEQPPSPSLFPRPPVRVDRSSTMMITGDLELDLELDLGFV